MNEQSPDYEAAWSSYRANRRRAIRLAIAIGPLALLVGLGGVISPTVEYLLFLLWVAYALAAAVPAFRWLNWPCPRCGRDFTYTGRALSWRPFTSSCVNCGLPKYSAKDPDGDAAT